MVDSYDLKFSCPQWIHISLLQYDESIFHNVSQASHIKKLTNINYVTWSVKLDMLLIHLELFGVVDGF